MPINVKFLIAVLAGFCVLTFRPATQAQSPPTPARPIIELDKTRFSSNEEVFFWVGVTAPDDYRIPSSLWTTCRLTITRPDGTQRIDVVGWPIDGMLDHAWRGGWSLRSEPMLTGHGGSQPIPDGEYDLRFSTIVQMLVGQRDGSWADLSPIRFNITSVKHVMFPR